MRIFKYIFLGLLMPVISFSFTGKGTGTENDPYQITNLNQLQEMNDAPDWSKYYVLVNDIDATETKDWNMVDHDNDSITPDVPLGWKPMAGGRNLDGRGFIIKNLYINEIDYGSTGFFSEFNYNFTLKRIGLENCLIIGNGYVGAFAAIFSSGEISECYSTGLIIANSGVSAGFYVLNAGTSVANCYSNCTVESKSNPDNDEVISAFGFGGGMSHLNCYHCYATGKVIDSSDRASVFGTTVPSAGYYFWDIETTGVANDTIEGRPNGGRSTADMMKRSTFQNWDFQKIWYIDEGMDYPKLRAFLRDTTDVKEGINHEHLSISPNPSINFIEISVINPMLKHGVDDSNIKIYDVFGQNCDLTPALSTRGEGVRIDVSGLAPGMYFVRIGDKVQKFIKL